MTGSLRGLAEVAPARLTDIDVVVLRRLLDVGERQLAVVVRGVLHLIEPGQRVAHVAGVGQRFLALLREGEDGVREVVLLRGGELTVRGVGLPGGAHAAGLPRRRRGVTASRPARRGSRRPRASGSRWYNVVMSELDLDPPNR